MKPLAVFVDIDECDLPGTCRNGKCRNLPGSYSCTCNKGFEEKDGGCKGNGGQQFYYCHIYAHLYGFKITFFVL